MPKRRFGQKRSVAASSQSSDHRLHRTADHLNGKRYVAVLVGSRQTSQTLAEFPELKTMSVASSCMCLGFERRAPFSRNELAREDSVSIRIMLAIVAAVSVAFGFRPANSRKDSDQPARIC
jgi:hypothetical protein